MKKRINQIYNWIGSKISLIKPGNTAYKGAAVGLFFFTILIFILNGIIMAISIKDPFVLLLVLAMTLVVVLAGFVLAWMIKLVFQIHRSYKLALLICLPLLYLVFMIQELTVPYVILVSSLLGASFLVFRNTGFKNLSLPKKIMLSLGLFVGLAGFSAGTFYYVQRGLEADPIQNAARLNAEMFPHLASDSPSKQGSLTVNMLSYGSGNDKHREEYGEGITFKTDSVNGIPFLDNWSGFGGWWRKQYWGFDAKALPLNARVWYPEEEGTYPLVLIVHGNHSMTDFSDPGYAYLGELLASRGMILASVDQNFINGNWSDIFGGLEKENDARGWLLLEHLKVWHQWNQDPAHPFFNKIDTDNISLIGHSRGGEAVAHAALMNQLAFYPDDASIPLDYGFNIRSIVAIAPVDGQYQPGESLTQLQDVNYFVLHGSHDADVNTFMGSMQFERINFSKSDYFFKSGLYIYGANHGQFNTGWGDNDVFTPFKGLLNLGQLMPKEQQEEIAKVYISAFLETTLKGSRDYLPLFTDARYGRNWLPETIFLTQFEDSQTSYICTFDEDFDVQTGSTAGVHLSGKNLSVWKEQEIRLKKYKKGSRAVVLGWHYAKADKDSLEVYDLKELVPDSLIARYNIRIDPDLINVDSSSWLVFSMAESKESSNPKASGKWVDKKAEKNNNATVANNNAKEEKKKIDKKREKEAEKPLDLNIEMLDKNGYLIQFPLSKYSALQREISVKLYKLDFLLGKSESEKVFQKFSFPLRDIKQDHPQFDLAGITEISLVFDKVESGVVVLDNVGFMTGISTH